MKDVHNTRGSNLELYRIICMLMIVAHHYVVNSGLMGESIVLNPQSSNSIYLILFGAWGKTGINCFLMITGYFMCKSQITIRKFVKLLAQVYFYKILIFLVFLIVGYESITAESVIRVLTPFRSLSANFVGCFIVFYITIPFWNIMINNMTQREHQLLIGVLLFCYTVLGSIPSFLLQFNYVSWFGVIYLIASYVRCYPNHFFQSAKLWGIISLIVISLSCLVVFVMIRIHHTATFFLVDCNKLFAVVVAVCTFMWFKNLRMPNSKVINSFGAGTFGVLLIHANSNAMRTWLWQDTIDAVGHYNLPLCSLMLFSVVVVLTIFITCNLIDQIRIATIEKWFFNWYDNKVSVKADALVNKIIMKQ